jgi:hypothetical protein
MRVQLAKSKAKRLQSRPENEIPPAENLLAERFLLI